ncbi:MAG: hypothetical protein EAX90_01150 [Candidatus Heimdallarchaeota archaeon]|nr:hypothetical protein [Candidatus Heimdallarchaeota archaeon]
MSKKSKIKKISCKNCGESWLPGEVPTNKEWTKLAPMPDSEGRVTIMMMATWSCPSCGKNVMGLKGKYKDEGTSGPSKKELMIEMIDKSDGKISITEIAAELSLSDENVEKALLAFLKTKAISGKIENGFFIKN